MSIIEKAEALGQEIIETAEYNELKAAEEAIYSDKEAKSLLDDFQSKQKRLQMVQANGQQINQKQQKELQSLQTKMQGNDKIKAFMEAQQKFNDVMKTVNQTISSVITGENVSE